MEPRPGCSSKISNLSESYSPFIYAATGEGEAKLQGDQVDENHRQLEDLVFYPYIFLC